MVKSLFLWIGLSCLSVLGASYDVIELGSSAPAPLLINNQNIVIGKDEQGAFLWCPEKGKIISRCSSIKASHE